MLSSFESPPACSVCSAIKASFRIIIFLLSLLSYFTLFVVSPSRQLNEENSWRVATNHCYCFVFFFFLPFSPVGRDVFQKHFSEKAFNSFKICSYWTVSEKITVPSWRWSPVTWQHPFPGVMLASKWGKQQFSSIPVLHLKICGVSWDAFMFGTGFTCTLCSLASVPFALRQVFGRAVGLLRCKQLPSSCGRLNKCSDFLLMCMMIVILASKFLTLLNKASAYVPEKIFPGQLSSSGVGWWSVALLFLTRVQDPCLSILGWSPRGSLVSWLFVVCFYFSI